MIPKISLNPSMAFAVKPEELRKGQKLKHTNGKSYIVSKIEAPKLGPKEGYLQILFTRTEGKNERQCSDLSREKPSSMSIVLEEGEHIDFLSNYSGHANGV